MNKNPNQYIDDRYFRTQNFNTAVFLFAKGFELCNVDKTLNAKRAEFVFPNSLELEIAVHTLNFAKDNDSEILLSARTLFTAIKQLKNILYQDILS